MSSVAFSFFPFPVPTAKVPGADDRARHGEDKRQRSRASWHRKGRDKNIQSASLSFVDESLLFGPIGGVAKRLGSRQNVDKSVEGQTC